jgi:ABC-type thiamine transport system ATPase subunit
VKGEWGGGWGAGVGFRALRGVDLAIAAGEMVAITRPSGSGKTTIINLIAGIDRPTAGTVTVSRSRLDQMSEERLAVWRGRTIGIVFQFFQLMPTLTAAENATLPLDLARLGAARERKAAASRHLAAVGLGDRGDRLPLELSGGEQQRVAIARATAMNRQVQESHLNDVGISTSVIDLTPAQLSALGHLPGVAAVSPVLGYTAQATSAAGTQNVAIAGGNLASAPVNTVPLMSGRLPGPGEVLADVANGKATSWRCCTSSRSWPSYPLCSSSRPR